MNSNIDQTKKHTMGYWFEDGLSEIIVGGLFAIIGLFTLLQGMLEPGSFLAGISGVAAVIIIGLGIWLARSLISWLKMRITYPRTGYVSYHQPEHFLKGFTSILSGLIAALFAWLIIRFSVIIQVWVPVIEGAALGLFMLVIGQRTGLVRFYILMLLAVIFGAIFSLFCSSDLTSSGWFFVSIGFSLVASGLLALSKYLRTSQPSSGEPNGD